MGEGCSLLRFTKGWVMLSVAVVGGLSLSAAVSACLWLTVANCYGRAQGQRAFPTKLIDG